MNISLNVYIYWHNIYKYILIFKWGINIYIMYIYTVMDRFITVLINVKIINYFGKKNLSDRKTV